MVLTASHDLLLLMSALSLLLHNCVHSDISSKNDVLGFDCKLLSTCSDLIAPIIIIFANASIHTNCFASDWKLSRVTPIYKGKGGANDKGNYRPISVIGHRQNYLT